MFHPPPSPLRVPLHPSYSDRSPLPIARCQLILLHHPSEFLCTPRTAQIGHHSQSALKRCQFALRVELYIAVQCGSIHSIWWQMIANRKQIGLSFNVPHFQSSAPHLYSYHIKEVRCTEKNYSLFFFFFFFYGKPYYFYVYFNVIFTVDCNFTWKYGEKNRKNKLFIWKLYRKNYHKP